MFNHKLAQAEKSDHAAYVRDSALIAERERIAAVLDANPQIGKLNGGKFYAFVNGVYTESTNPVDLI